MNAILVETPRGINFSSLPLERKLEIKNLGRPIPEINITNTTIMYIIRKTLKGRKQTNKYGRGTERHLPKTDESVVRPVGEHR